MNNEKDFSELIYIKYDVLYKLNLEYSLDINYEKGDWVLSINGKMLLNSSDNTLKDLKKFVKKRKAITYESFPCVSIWMLCGISILFSILGVRLHNARLKGIGTGFCMAEVIVLIIHVIYFAIDNKHWKTMMDDIK